MKNKGLLVIILLLVCGLIAVIPLAVISDSEFGGADGQAEEIILEIAPDYEPWAESILEPPGGETESLLFSLQAALGAGIIGLGFGYFIARSKYHKEV
ncbi:MAG: energy-coupling factor ABC transporter substrate-binding protein [Clostridiales bacterium]